MNPIISLRRIYKSFDDTPVLRGVDLMASESEVVAIIGSSGSGKSTLLRCINLLEVPEAGSIEIAGEEIAFKGSSPAREPADPQQVQGLRARLGMVFQSFNLWSHMSVLQNVTEAQIHVLGRDKDAARERAILNLTRVGLAEKADAYPSQLSGGQQQRVAIARALAIDPLALLFDEPTSALDPELEKEVLRVIRALADEGQTMILVTHDMDFAREVADRVIFLNNGVVEEEGPADQIFTAPKSARLRTFLR